MRSLVGSFTGFGVPQYVLTTPLGKIPLYDEQLHADADGRWWVENYRNERMYIDDFVAQPVTRAQAEPADSA